MSHRLVTAAGAFLILLIAWVRPVSARNAAWVWLESAELTEADYNTAGELGVDKLWLSIGGSFYGDDQVDPDFERRVDRLEAAGFAELGYLTGSAHWLGEHRESWARVRELLFWHWVNRPGERFVLNLDVEPQQHEKWEEPGMEAELTGQLEDLVCHLHGRLKTLESDSELVISITEWMLGEGGVNPEKLADCSDSVSVMLYPRDAEELREGLKELKTVILSPYWAGINLRPEAVTSFSTEDGTSPATVLEAAKTHGGDRLRGYAFHALNYLSRLERDEGN